MIGAVEVTGLGTRIGADRQTKFFRRRLNLRIKIRALGAGDFDFLRRSQWLHIVVVQIERDLSRRNWRMLAQILRAQQALFFGRHRSEQNRTTRLD